ncbi:hypothetical protein JTB14_001189 [Gonioctena quinquepunctata]|nr:hypothetical protein JTB14_001189 [Gonioctena quinquepunctata]
MICDFENNELPFDNFEERPQLDTESYRVVVEDNNKNSTLKKAKTTSQDTGIINVELNNDLPEISPEIKSSNNGDSIIKERLTPRQETTNMVEDPNRDYSINKTETSKQDIISNMAGDLNEDPLINETETSKQDIISNMVEDFNQNSQRRHKLSNKIQ